MSASSCAARNQTELPAADTSVCSFSSLDVYGRSIFRRRQEAPSGISQDGPLRIGHLRPSHNTGAGAVNRGSIRGGEEAA